MKQIVLTMPEALVSEIQWVASEEDRPEAEIIREALRAYLGRRRLAQLRESCEARNRSSQISEDDQYLADLAEPYR